MGCSASHQQEKEAARQAVEAAQMRDLQRRTRGDSQHPTRASVSVIPHSSSIVSSTAPSRSRTDHNAEPQTAIASSSMTALAQQRQSKSTAVYDHEHSRYIEQDMVIEDEDDDMMFSDGYSHKQPQQPPQLQNNLVSANGGGSSFAVSSSSGSKMVPQPSYYSAVGPMYSNLPQPSLSSHRSTTTSSFSAASPINNHHHQSNVSAAVAVGNSNNVVIQVSRFGNGGTHNVGQPSNPGSSYYSMPFNRTNSNMTTSYSAAGGGGREPSFAVASSSSSGVGGGGVGGSFKIATPSSSFGGGGATRRSIPDGGGDDAQQPWKKNGSVQNPLGAY